MPPSPPSPHDDALAALHRQRQTARKWALLVVACGLLIVALFAPRTALLVFVLLVVFGTLGTAIGYVLRVFSRWFDAPKGP